MRSQQYDQLFQSLDALCEGEDDAIALMATIACELFRAFENFNWVGFYRNVDGQILKIGPYQGSHGCLRIPFSRGVCGKCAREKAIQNVPDTAQVPDHIACSDSTRSELVVPILDHHRDLIAVLDIDSDTLAAFDTVDETNLSRISQYFQKKG